MRKQVRPYQFTDDDEELLRVFHQSQMYQWKNNIIIAGEAYHLRRDALKDAIRLHLLQDQNRQCAYCGLTIREHTPAIEHIADKSKLKYKSVMFNPLNLVLTCSTCNSVKGIKDAVSNWTGNYPDWDFIIVHPILDQPSDHIEFDREFVIILNVHTDKGQNTIEWFNLQEEVMIRERLRISLAAQSVVSPEMEALIQQSIAVARTRVD